MAIYMIGYDLHRSHEDRYDKLYAALEAIGSGYWDCLESTWLLITDKTAAQIKEQLEPHLEDGDRLLVMRYGEGAAWVGFTDECLGWKTSSDVSAAALTPLPGSEKSAVHRRAAPAHPHHRAAPRAPRSRDTRPATGARACARAPAAATAAQNT